MFHVKHYKGGEKKEVINFYNFFFEYEVVELFKKI